MKILERLDFRNKYGVSTVGISKGIKGETLDINGHKITVKEIENKTSSDGFVSNTMLLSENGEDFILDLSPHWERGPEGDIHMCREGVMNLIKAVYAQAEKDYEELYIGGKEACELEQLPGEKTKDYERRRNINYQRMVRECEQLLGPVFVKYAKVKALWKSTKDVNVIAKKLGDTPEHIANLVERLGLNRTEMAQNDTEEE